MIKTLNKTTFVDFSKTQRFSIVTNQRCKRKTKTNLLEVQITNCRANYLFIYSSLSKSVHLISKNAIMCLFLENVSPSRRAVYFILNNLHFPIVEGIAFYALYKSRVIIPCKADDFCLFIELPDKIKKRRLLSLSSLEFNFFIVLWNNLKKTLHYWSYIVSNIKNFHSVLEQCSNLFLVIKKWRRKSIDLATLVNKWWTQAYPFYYLYSVLLKHKNYIITGLVSNFFNSPCKRVTSSLQKRKHY